MAYGGVPATDQSDAVRLLVGDIGATTSVTYLDDADYDFFIGEGGNIYVAAQLAANSLAALFMGSAASAGASGYVEKQVGDLRLKKADANQMAQSYRQLAQKFSRMAASKVAPYAGGITISDKRLDEDDSDRVKPFFTRRLLDNPNADSMSGGGSTSGST
jgi:hypothetical protein